MSQHEGNVTPPLLSGCSPGPLERVHIHALHRHRQSKPSKPPACLVADKCQRPKHTYEALNALLHHLRLRQEARRQLPRHLTNELVVAQALAALQRKRWVVIEAGGWRGELKEQLVQLRTGAGRQTRGQPAGSCPGQPNQQPPPRQPRTDSHAPS